MGTTVTTEGLFRQYDQCQNTFKILIFDCIVCNANFVCIANFKIVKFPFLDGDVPHSPSCGVYSSQLIRFARVCSHVDGFNNRNNSKSMFSC